MDEVTRNKIELSVLRTAVTSRERTHVMLDAGEDIFSSEDHKRIFRIIEDRSRDGVDVDALVVYANMAEFGFKDNQIVEFQQKFSTAETTLHIRELIKKLRHQNYIESMRAMTVDVYNGIKKNEMTFDEMVEAIGSVYDKINAGPTDHCVDMAEMSSLSLGDIYSRSGYVRTGINELDKNIVGIFNGQLVVIAARPGMGKSSLALQIAQNIPGRVLMFSLEMNRREIYARYLSQAAKVEAWRIECGKMNDEEKARVLKAHSEARHKINIRLYDRENDVTKIIRSIRNHGNSKLAVIDYLQLMSGGEGNNRVEKIGDMTRRLKAEAHNSGNPIILLSQLNRSVEHHDREPILSDLRESGAIEQDADVVLFLHNENIICAKNRKGRIFKTKTRFEKKYCVFGLPAEGNDAEGDLPVGSLEDSEGVFNPQHWQEN